MRVVSTVPRAITTALCFHCEGVRHDVDGAAVLPDAHAGHSHPIVRLRLGDELLHMAVGNNHNPLARICCWPGAVGLITSEARCTNHGRDSAEFVRRKESGEGCGLNREWCFEFEQLLEIGNDVVSVGGKPSQSRRIVALRGVRQDLVADCGMIEQFSEYKSGPLPADFSPSRSCLRSAVWRGP